VYRLKLARVLLDGQFQVAAELGWPAPPYGKSRSDGATVYCRRGRPLVLNAAARRAARRRMRMPTPRDAVLPLGCDGPPGSAFGRDFAVSHYLDPRTQRPTNLHGWASGLLRLHPRIRPTTTTAVTTAARPTARARRWDEKGSPTGHLAIRPGVGQPGAAPYRPRARPATTRFGGSVSPDDRGNTPRRWPGKSAASNWPSRAMTTKPVLGGRARTQSAPPRATLERGEGSSAAAAGWHPSPAPPWPNDRIAPAPSWTASEGLLPCRSSHRFLS
jgi:hypothetical protein